MAQAPIRISPFDLTPNRAIGVSLPFNGSAVFNSTYTSRDQIKTNLINFFLTNQGERPFNTTLGGNLRRVTFEQLTSETELKVKNIVLNSLELYFPRVIPKELKVNSYPDSNALEIYLRYIISETNIEDNITLNIQQ